LRGHQRASITKPAQVSSRINRSPSEQAGVTAPASQRVPDGTLGLVVAAILSALGGAFFAIPRLRARVPRQL
jgi:hypothetical protein